MINEIKDKVMPYKKKIDNYRNKKIFEIRGDMLIYAVLAVIAMIILAAFWWGILIILVIYIIFYERNKAKKKRQEAELLRRRRLEEEERRRREYINKLSPENPDYYITVDIDDGNANNFLGAKAGNKINYMFIDTSKVITFPESFYGNDRGYYLINVDFKKSVTERIQADTSSESVTKGRVRMGGFSHTNSKSENNSRGYDSNGPYGGYREQIFRGTTTSSSNGMFGAKGSYNGQTSSKGQINGNIIKEEVPTNAFLTFVTTDKEHSFIVKLEDQVEESVNSINQYFKLNDFEQKKLGLK